MPRLSPSEILEVATTLERNGEKFYREAERKFDDPEIRETFRFLAQEEVKHERLFAKLLAQLTSYEPPEQFTEEYFGYLRAYVTDVVFTESRFDELVAGITDPIAAVRFAKQREQDTILFYLELRELIPTTERKVIDEIIQEERLHYFKLSRLESARTHLRA